MPSSLDPLLLSRIQFGANISFHILFPTISIALGWVLLFFKLRFDATHDEKWMEAYAFWVKIFALTFALGVVSGITMSFQFGTNWPGYMQTVGNIAGPLLAYEVMTAFFLEATFLGVMLFGRSRVSNRVHTLATFLVAAGTTLSAFWILALNSWMQTPAGYTMRPDAAGHLVAHVTDWWAVIFNPSFPYRFMHMMTASFLTVSFLLSGLSAYRRLKGDRSEAVATSLRTGLFAAALLTPLQIALGDLHGLNTFEHQPAKIAAMEATWDTERGAPAVLFALPDERTRSNHLEIAIPKLASLYLTHSFDGEVKGLNDFKGNHPPVLPLFIAFRLMVGVGLLMLALSWYGAWHLRSPAKQSLTTGATLPKPLLRALVFMSFSGWIATLAGWYVTEMGRQPWLVTNVLKTADAVAQIPSPMIGLTLAMYLALYALLTVAYVTVVFYLARKSTHQVKENLT